MAYGVSNKGVAQSTADAPNVRRMIPRMNGVRLKYYEDFARSAESLWDRMGDPTAFDAAMGILAINFGQLEDSVRHVMVLLIGADEGTGDIAVAELGFKQRLDTLGSLVWHRLPEYVKPDEQDSTRERVRELIYCCRRAEELRNTYLHSSYIQGVRSKSSAKARHGLRTTVEQVDAGLIFDVADYILGVAMDVEALPMHLDIADTVRGCGGLTEYVKSGNVVASFQVPDLGSLGSA